MAVLSGLHWTNRAEVTEADLSIMLAGHFRLCKLLHIHSCKHTPVMLRTIASKAPFTAFIVRLSDSRWPHETRPDESYIPSPATLAANWFNTIVDFYAEGVRLFQCDNEPNLSNWPSYPYGPDNYQNFMKATLRILRKWLEDQHLDDVELISPPLSFAPSHWRLDPTKKLNPTDYILDDWFAAYQFTDGGREPALLQMFDAVGVNAYWQNIRQMYDPSYGGCFEQMHSRSGGKKVFILEYGNSAGMEEGGPDRADMVAFMKGQYPAYLRWLNGYNYCKGAVVFIERGTDDWAPFEVDEEVARAISYYNRNKWAPPRGPWAQ